MSQWLQLFGRLHPMVLHLPIGLIVGMVTLELFALIRRKPLPREITAALVWLAAATAVFSATTGFVLSYEGTFSGSTLDTHLKLGIAVAIAATIGALLHRRGSPAAYRALLLTTAVLLVPAGHLGASMTHGEDFLTAPLANRSVGEGRKENVTTESGGTSVPQSFSTVIQPILESRCTSCHSGSRGKGGLKLDSVDAIRQGGKHGVIFVAGKPKQSEIVRRLRLPSDADGHMPPRSKPQPTDAEIRALEAWIAGGAMLDATSPDTAVASADGSADSTATDKPTAAESPDTETVAATNGLPQVAPAPAAALDALQQRFVHVESAGHGSNLLWIDFAAVATTTGDAQAAGLLGPVLPQVGELSLARSAITDATLTLVARMPHLRRLDLRATKVTRDGIAALRDHTGIEELVVAQTQLSDSAIDSLLTLPALKLVHVWRCGLTGEAVERLKRERPALQVDAGDEADAAPLETEGELKYSSDAPLPGQAPATASLKPVNAKCPVTGSPVDPKFLIVFKGRVIGFCCPNCPKEFWTDPAKFESKIE